MAEREWDQARPRTANGEQRLRQHATETREHAQAFARSLGDVMKDLDTTVRDLSRKNPYAAIGAAFGIGLLLGGGIPPALFRTLIGLAGRYALDALTRSGPSGARQSMEGV